MNRPKANPTRQLAERIARRLFMCGRTGQIIADELRQIKSPGTYLGGWIEPCIADLIERELKAAKKRRP